MDLGIHKDFNIPKLHSMQHYISVIHSFSSTDGFNTKSPKCFHIDYEKQVYRPSNQVDYYTQMTKWLQHQEVIHWHYAYLE